MNQWLQGFKFNNLCEDNKFLVRLKYARTKLKNQKSDTISKKKKKNLLTLYNNRLLTFSPTLQIKDT